MGLAADIKSKFKSEVNKTVVNIIYTNNWIEDQIVKLLKPYGLTGPQYNILRILRGQYPNPATVNLLIDRMLDKSSNASRIVDKLEAKKLVKRSQCKNDRRAVDVVITQKGLDILTKIDGILEAWETKFNALSNQNLNQLNDLLDQFRDSFQEHL